MRKLLVTLIALTSLSASAALPPQYQNPKDLKVMTSYIYDNVDVLEGLKKINFWGKTIEFRTYDGGECIAIFKRKERQLPPGWVGPAADLIYSHTECERD